MSSAQATVDDAAVTARVKVETEIQRLTVLNAELKALPADRNVYQSRGSGVMFLTPRTEAIDQTSKKLTSAHAERTKLIQQNSQ